MKLSLLLALFCLTFLARSQLPTNGSSWTVTDADLNTVLGHPNEACWPNGTVTLFYNRSGYTFTATNWSGPACNEYNLTAQTTFSLPNDNFFGYVNNNQSVQFNFGLINSTNMMINLWYGCVGALDCDTTATVYLSIVSACSFSINSVPFNTCPLAANNLYFNVTANIEGYIIMSLGAPSVLNCAGDQYIWAVLHNKNGSTCHDIAAQNPSYSLQYESNPEQGGLLLTFPVQQAENETASFQLVIDLDCYPSVWNPLDHSLSMQGFNMNGTTNLTTINLWGFSGYGCVQSKNSCPPVIIGGNVYAYNACLLNQTIYNISDSYGGVLSFNLGDTPIVQTCPGQSPAIVYGIYNTNTGKCLVASSQFNEPAYQALNQSNPNQGLQISMGEGVSYNTGGVSDTYVTLNLLCDANQTDLLLLNPPMILSQQPSGALALQVNGTSPYACPINSSTTNTIIV